MRSAVPVLAVAVLALAAGCADSTSPTAAVVRAPASPSALVGNPPPPPIDTGSYASTPQGGFSLNATYFLNPSGNSGFIHFPSGQPVGVSISPNAQIRYHQGTVTGMGTITAPVSGGIVSIDLSSINSGRFPGACKDGCAAVPFTGTYTDKSGETSSFTDGLLIIGSSGPGTDQGPPTRGD